MDDRYFHPLTDCPHLMREDFPARPHPHPDEDELPTLVINQNTVQPAEDMEHCKVCDRLATGTHYGASVCGCCASFFRRTIGTGKSYQCSCRFPFRNKKKGCRHCRFNNCLKAGMDAKVVQAIRPFPQPNDTLLSQLHACRNRVYISRGLLLREMDARRVENSRWSVPLRIRARVFVAVSSFMEPTSHAQDLGRGRSYECLTHVEHRGLTQYWTDFLRCVPLFKKGVSPTLLTRHFLAIWLMLEQILATVTHGRIDKEVCLSDYETTLPLTYDGLYAFWSRHATNFFGDPATLATLTLENGSETIQISKMVRRASLDSLEVTALMHFLIAYYEREMFVDDASLKEFVNQVLRELHDHYKSTYKHYHERLCVITSIVGEFHRLIRLNEQFYMQLSLYTRSGKGLQLPSQKEPVNNLHDLRRSAKNEILRV